VKIAKSQKRGREREREREIERGGGGERKKWIAELSLYRGKINDNT
jgi:hypothetical protein